MYTGAYDCASGVQWVVTVKGYNAGDALEEDIDGTCWVRIDDTSDEYDADTSGGAEDSDVTFTYG